MKIFNSDIGQDVLSFFTWDAITMATVMTIFQDLAMPLLTAIVTGFAGGAFAIIGRKFGYKILGIKKKSSTIKKKINNIDKKKVSPYQFMEKEEMFYIMDRQLDYFGAQHMREDVRRAVYDSKIWNPTIDYNGCNLITDRTHPSISCFIHDYRWFTGESGAKELYYNQLLFGSSRIRATLMYLATSIAWLFYGRWKKHTPKSKR